MAALIGTDAGVLGIATFGRVRTNTFETLQRLATPTVTSIEEARNIARDSQQALRALRPGHFTNSMTRVQGSRAAEDATAAAAELAITQQHLSTLATRLKTPSSHLQRAKTSEVALGQPLRSAMEHLSKVQMRISNHLPRDDLHLLPVAAAPSARPSWATDAFLDTVGPLGNTRTQRLHELPYGVPKGFQINRVAAGAKLDLGSLDPAKSYLWAMDVKGGFIYAPEKQAGFGVTTKHPNGRLLKHGDLLPMDAGLHRAPARGGGILQVQRHDDGTINLANDGKPLWQVDNNSSYNFVRGDWKWKGWEGNTREAYTPGESLNDDNILAVRNMLVRGGADANHLAAANYLHFTLESPEHPQWFSSIVQDISHDAIWTVSNAIRLAEKLPPGLVNWVKAHKPGQNQEGNLPTARAAAAGSDMLHR